MSTGPDHGIAESLPGLARLAAGAWVRTASWGIGTSLRIGARLAQAAVDPESALELAHGVGETIRGYARDALGVADLDARVTRLVSPAAQDGAAADGAGDPNGSLRIIGAELLRKSADVDDDDGIHPAYVRILQELAPDEARILRLLAVEGPQPSVDVRRTNLIGVGSELVAPGLNMIGVQAGVRHRERVPAYLNNLERLGLIWFSREPLDDPAVYQVLEAQPEVLNAIKGTSRAKTIQRSFHLTPFGHDFCEVCLPLETGEIDAVGSERSQISDPSAK